MGIFGKALKRAHPSVITNPKLYGFGTGQESRAGVEIDENSSLSATAMWSAVSQLSHDCACLPLHLMKNLKNNGGKDKHREHGLYNILHLQPNDYMTSVEFRTSIVGQAMLWGFHCSEIVSDNAGKITSLVPMLSKKIDIKVTEDDVYYIYTLDSGRKIIYPSRKVLKVIGFSMDGLIGINPIKKMGDSIGLALALERYGATFFKNGAAPPIVLEHPETLSADAQALLRKSWDDIHRGIDNSHRMAILEEGMKIHEYGISPTEAQAIDTRRFMVEDVARITNMPVHRLKEMSRATFNNIEHQGIEYVQYTLMPWCKRIEENLDTKLLTSSEQKKFFFEHSVDGLLRGDSTARSAFHWKMFQMGQPPNRIFDLENLPHVEGGDESYIQANMIPMSMIKDINLPEPSQSAPATTKPGENSAEPRMETRATPIGRIRIQKNYHPMFLDAAQRVVNRETIAVKRAAAKFLGKRGAARVVERSVPDFEGWLTEFYSDMPNHIKKVIGPVIRSYCEAIAEQAHGEIGQEPEITPELQRFIDDYLESYSARHIESSLGQLAALVRDEENKEEAIAQRVDEWNERRGDKIADNETVRAGGAIAAFIFLGSGRSAVWRNVGESCPYCTSLEGKRIRGSQVFFKGGEDFEPGGATNGPMKIGGLVRHPPLHQGCDCMIGSGSARSFEPADKEERVVKDINFDLDTIEVDVNFLREATGEVIRIKDTAGKAMRDIDMQIETYEKILDCLSA